MQKAFSYCLPVIVLLVACLAKSGNDEKPTPVPAGDSIRFSAHVMPIMQKNCSPCHFPGGKMYQRMPFDQDTTIIHHQASILKRIKNEEENIILKKFLSSQ